MKCPHCDNELQMVGTFAVCPVHRIVDVPPVTAGAQNAGSPAANLPASELHTRVLTSYPFAIAHGLHRVITAESAASAVDCVFFTYEATLRFSALVLISQFLQSPQQNPQVSRVAPLLRMPHLNDWFTVLNAFAKHLFPQSGNGYASFAEGGPLSAELVRAARKLSKLQHGPGQVHGQFLKLRNLKAHFPPWDEQRCREELPGLTALLDSVLELFAPVASLTVLRLSSNGFVSMMVGAHEPFPEMALTDPAIEALFDDSSLVVRGPDNAALPLYPLFLGQEILAEGYQEPLLLFAGHTQRNAAYLGVRCRAESQEAFERYENLLATKHISPLLTRESMKPWQVADWAREATLGVVENLRGVKYFPEFYQERRAAGTVELEGDKRQITGIDDAVERWLAAGKESALIVAAEAGSGKTSLFCRLSEQLLGTGVAQSERSHDDCVLLLLGAAVREGQNLFDLIRLGLGVSAASGGIAQFNELLSIWQRVSREEDAAHESRRLMLLVDAVNEAWEPKALLEEIAGLAAAAAAANKQAGRAFVRLLISVRAERIETLQARWAERSDTPFLQYPENFAHFEDARGQLAPYLSLRAFTEAEAAAAYDRAQSALEKPCPAPWTSLAPTTRRLLCQPLMLTLFHQAYAGRREFVSSLTGEALWAAWLNRSFDPRYGRAALEQRALDLADRCIDLGANQVPQDVADEWTRAWRVEQGDPARISAELDWLERLSEAGLLRRTESGGYDWVSDSLAEQVYWRALRRRDPALREASVRAWLALPATPRLDGALVQAGMALWQSGRASDVRWLMNGPPERASAQISRIVLTVAPLGAKAEISTPLERFGAGLRDLLGVDKDMPIEHTRLLLNILQRQVWPVIESRLGSAPALGEICGGSLELATKLADLEPDNRQYLRDLSVSYNQLGDLDGRDDPAQARDWFGKGLAIRERLADLEPDNRQYLRDLSLSYDRLGDLDGRDDPAQARDWFGKGLAIRERLADLEPDNRRYLRDLSVSYGNLGDIELAAGNKLAAREWLTQGLAVAERLLTKDPTSADYKSIVDYFRRRLGGADSP